MDSRVAESLRRPVAIALCFAFLAPRMVRSDSGDTGTVPTVCLDRTASDGTCLARSYVWRDVIDRAECEVATVYEGALNDAGQCCYPFSCVVEEPPHGEKACY